MFRTKLVRAETQVLDAKAGVVQVAASDESEDRDGDVIRAAGWQLDHFQRHPVLLSSHNYMSLRSQIGEWEDVGVKNKRLVGVARYYVGEGNDEADWGFKLASRGRAAYSVGFIPLEYQERGEKGGYEFTKQELLEISHVTIPSNRNALQLMAGKGLLHPELDEIAREVLGEEETKDPEELDRSHRALADLHASLCTLGEACPAATKGIPHLVHAHVQAEVAVKGPIRSHDTAVVRRSWDGPAVEASIPNDAGAAVLRGFYAWVDTSADTDTKAAYKFIHHHNENGRAGAANLTACTTGIGVLNGARGGADIPDSDRRGVWRHLASHIEDADEEPPELRAAAPPEVRLTFDIAAETRKAIEEALI